MLTSVTLLSIYAMLRSRRLRRVTTAMTIAMIVWLLAPKAGAAPSAASQGAKKPSARLSTPLGRNPFRIYLKSKPAAGQPEANRPAVRQPAEQQILLVRNEIRVASDEAPEIPASKIQSAILAEQIEQAQVQHVEETVPPADPWIKDEQAEESQISAIRIYRPITEVAANATLPPGLTPGDDADNSPAPNAGIPEFGDARLSGAWAQMGVQWSATALCHGPLYFEQINLERYGYGVCPLLQPAYTSAHFFLTIPALPYKMAVHPPRECIYTLGYYRPGDRVPWQLNLPPWQARAGAVQAATAVGLVFLIP